MAEPDVMLTWDNLLRFGAGFLGIGNLGFGIAIVVGGTSRFPPPTYLPLLEYSGGRAWPYGLAFLAAGTLCLTSSRVMETVGLLVGFLSMSLLCSLFLWAVSTYPTAAGTAWWAYFLFAVQHATVLGLMQRHRHSGRMGPLALRE